MPYEVFSPFTRCAAVHGVHSNLAAAAACYNEIDAELGGDMPSWKHTGKHIHVVGAVDRRGKQRVFTDREDGQARCYGLPPEAILTEEESITTFYNIAEMYYEASKLMPISNISLEGMFDYEARDKHFWSTTAGMGQAFSFAQHVAFTVEFSLKALLEYSGKFLVVPECKWHTHDLVSLFGFLDEQEKEDLEQKWRSLPESQRQSHETLYELLKTTRNQYMDWRYIPTLKSTELSMDVTAMLSASRLMLSLAERTFHEASPMSSNVTSQVYPPDEHRDPALIPDRVWVEGLVQSVSVPESFDPHSEVEVLVEPDFYYNGRREIPFNQEVTARFQKSQVESYYGLEGERVSLTGWSTAAERHILNAASHRDAPRIEPSYALDRCTLHGTVYNLIPAAGPPTRTRKITLVLSDSTYYTSVDCMFVTDIEQEMLNNVQLGDEITISGQATLVNGKPVTLVGPEIVDQQVSEA